MQPGYPIKTASGTNVIITVKEYEQLKRDQAFLECLHAAGVDNWCGYDAAQEMMED